MNPLLWLSNPVVCPNFIFGFSILSHSRSSLMEFVEMFRLSTKVLKTTLFLYTSKCTKSDITCAFSNEFLTYNKKLYHISSKPSKQRTRLITDIKLNQNEPKLHINLKS